MNKNILEKLKALPDVRRFVFYVESDANSNSKKGLGHGTQLLDGKGENQKKLLQNFEAIQQYAENIGMEFRAKLAGIEFKGEDDTAVCYSEKTDNQIKHLVVVANSSFDVKGFLENIKESKNQSTGLPNMPTARRLFAPLNLKADRAGETGHLLSWEANGNEPGTKYLVECAISQQFFRGADMKPEESSFKQIHIEEMMTWLNKAPGKHSKGTVFYRIRTTDGRDFSDYCGPISI